jgi:hypothetical protein
VTNPDSKQLLTLLLAQRLEFNAIESALQNANLLSNAQIRELRAQASDTANAWSSREDDDVF